jgi:hypothetical protein
MFAPGEASCALFEWLKNRTEHSLLDVWDTADWFQLAGAMTTAIAISASSLREKCGAGRFSGQSSAGFLFLILFAFRF